MAGEVIRANVACAGYSLTHSIHGMRVSPCIEGCRRDRGNRGNKDAGVAGDLEVMGCGGEGSRIYNFQ